MEDGIVGQKEKLIRRLLSKPKDFTFDEVKTLLRYLDYHRLDYHRSDKGRISGSRVMFTSEKHAPIMMHKPHPRKELLEYQIRQLIDVLKQEGLL